MLQNQTTISNGYVGLGPFRSEYFLTPLQNSFELGSLRWTDQLALHEFRHVQQYNNFNVGLSNVFRILFGEEGQALANNAVIPNWFFEGDAVFNETNASLQGRGRLPYFYKSYRSLWEANKKYSWMKLRNGSYEDYVPDHYALGYLLVAYGREKYGALFWKNVSHDAAAFKGLFYPFQKAIKKYSGKSFVEFRNDALQYFKNTLARSGTGNKETNNKETEKYISYEYPSFTNANALVFVKSSYRDVAAFYILDQNGERKIRTKDVSLDNYFSCRKGKIVYASYRPDKRWGYRDYSELQVLDVGTGKQRTIKRRSKYFSPDISEDGRQVVAVKVEPNGKATLEILNAENGNIILAVPNTQNLFYTYPKFYGPDKIISAVRNQAGQMTLAQISRTTGTQEYLLPFSFNVMGFPCVWQDTIYFSASHGKDDRLFAYSIKHKQLLATAPSLNEMPGYYQPAANDNKIALITFTANGFKPVLQDKSTLTFKIPGTTYFKDTMSNFGISALDTSNAVLLSSVPLVPLPFRSYPKTTRLFNFHSIEPNADDPEYSITLVSQNILNTLQSQVSFTYNRNEQFKKIGFNAVYSALFPYISAGIDYTIDRRARYRGQRVYWNETEPGAGINIPLNLSKGRSIIAINIGTRYLFNQTTYKGAFKDTLGKVSYSYLSNIFTLTNQVQKAKQQIYPRYAQTLSINLKSAITKYKSSQLVADANIYFPGIFSNQSVVINTAFLQKSRQSQINFSSNFPFSRGYNSEDLFQMFKWGVNYHLPLLYPDRGFANIIYLLRTRGNLFYDDTRVSDFFTNGSPFNASFRSAGVEIFFDTKWWNEIPLTFGIRYSHLLNPDLFSQTRQSRWELILPVSFL